MQGQPCLIDRVQASDGGILIRFGEATAIGDIWAVVGAPHAPISGAAYMFKHDGALWLEAQKLNDPITNEWLNIGRAVAMRGDEVVIVGTGAESAYVFDKVDGVWFESQILVAWDSPAPNSFGAAVPISEDRIAVGAWYDADHGNMAGAAYVFRHDGKEWAPEQKVHPDDAQPSHMFGQSVALHGDTLAIGAPLDFEACGPDADPILCIAGAVYIFEFDPESEKWLQKQKLLPPPLDDFLVLTPHMGWSVAFSGDTLIAGSTSSTIVGIDEEGNVFFPPCGATKCGIAYIFTLDPVENEWVPSQILLPEQPGTKNFGISVAIDGDRGIIGGNTSEVDGGGSEGNYVGAAFLYERQFDNTWNQTAMFLPQPNPSWTHHFGKAVAISGDQVLVGAWGEQGATGAAYFYRAEAPGDLTCDGSVGVAAYSNFCKVGASARSRSSWTPTGSVAPPISRARAPWASAIC